MIAIRALAEHAEFVEAVKLQKVIWGFDDIDLLPVRLFVVASKIGGQVLGAFAILNRDHEGEDSRSHTPTPNRDRQGADSQSPTPTLNRDRQGAAIESPAPTLDRDREGADSQSPAPTLAIESPTPTLNRDRQGADKRTDLDKIVGFLVSLPALKPSGASYLHSHMLGVLDEYRNAGAGRMLKLEQRKEALDRGIALVEWTFDPLEIKNAHFNIERLGAIATRYVVNQYGVTTSRLQAGMPTDRCTAEWWIASPRVQSIVSGLEPVRPPIVARISLPADIDTIKRTDPMRAREIQSRVSDQFQEHFSNNLAVVGFERTGASATYLLAPYKGC